MICPSATRLSFSVQYAFVESKRTPSAFLISIDSGGCKGLDAIKTVRDEDPATFARTYATVQPKQLEIEDPSPEAALSNEQLNRSIRRCWPTGSQLGRRVFNRSSLTPVTAQRVEIG
jgi:hypothetical protein